jgi:nucleoside-diphosphate-sugar epimerase
MELLLTGATGFVGRNLLLRLITAQTGSRWSRIILPVRNPKKLQNQLADEGIGIPGNLTIFRVEENTWELPSDVCPDLVIHAAGQLFGREREGYFQTNVSGSLNLAARLSGNARMIVLSSLAAGGPTPQGEIARTTDHQDMPVSYYGESKLAMERALRERLGERLLILRPPMVLGPRDAATVPLFKMAKGRVRVKPGFRQKQYSWIAVEDLCEALLSAAVSEWVPCQKPFYLTAKQTITDELLLATAAEVINARGITLPLPHAAIQGVSWVLDVIPALRDVVLSLGPDRVREILPDRWICDGGDFSESFNWEPRMDFPETLRSTAEWLKSRGRI